MDELTAVDELITALNASGVEFQRDTWFDVNGSLDNADYGVVKLTGAPMMLWGDDKLIEQNIQGNVILYVRDGEDSKAKAVQDILKERSVSFRLTGTEYLTDMNMNRWIWQFGMDQYLNGTADD